MLKILIALAAILIVAVYYRHLGISVPIKGSLFRRLVFRVRMARFQLRWWYLTTNQAGVSFIRKGKTKFYWFPGTTVTNSAAALNATKVAVDIDLADIAGFSFTNSPISKPSMDKVFTTQVPGEDTAEASSLTWYEDDVTNNLQTVLAKGSVGVMYIFYAGHAGAAPAAAAKYEAWPMQSGGFTRLYTVGNELAQYRVPFAPIDTPTMNGTLVA